MLKKILFLGFTLSILIFSNNLSAEINSIVPLKKPVLSKEEIQKKISINILKPLKKPSKTKEVKIEEVIVKKELILKEKKLSFKIPKKKPTVAGISTAKNIFSYIYMINSPTFVSLPSGMSVIPPGPIIFSGFKYPKYIF